MAWSVPDPMRSAPDLLAVAPFYLDWAGIGGGVQNYLTFGDFPTQEAKDWDAKGLWFKPGFVRERQRMQNSVC